ncbi:hypothetical protein SAMN04487995_1598 [Dyadobacter koreensis]|uniref:DUF1835 domain-containing protein n=1 Tax=Dyadobacter koreensis TaxID=408657 RepID=A0A1H6S656_9BACT|nr:hypothetical protein [Dyadobacter koreensis]SEI60287.1 hypothetical protein SAMN04487995_1598 [Dyadobacter koreensis]
MAQNKIFHIVNGDALLDNFPAELLTGEIIVARECLVDGPVSGENFQEFAETRANFIHQEYGEEKQAYFEEIIPEFNKIQAIPADSEINFWFEDDLFCQVNLWFCVSLLMPVAHTLKAYIIKPVVDDNQPDWRGFGIMDSHMLAEAYLHKQLLSQADLSLLNDLWLAYRDNDLESLQKSSEKNSVNFPFLNLVIQAQIDRRNDRPENVLKEIMKEKETTDFNTIFKEFSKREGIYGFGDWQVEKMLERIQNNKVQE